ncbi:type IV pilin protein [Variovorax paradoxus]|uniref:type IV pilin protein n=1 Tax=Variovorax paradoxus TaxID=34073 RepID=UPI003D65E1C7
MKAAKAASGAASRTHGFTLIEVMMVVAILAILAATSYPSYQGFMRKGWRTEARSALLQQMQQQERQYTMTGQYKRYEGGSGEGGAAGKYLVESGNCEGQGTIDRCIRLTATPKSGYSDAEVGALWIDSMGDKGCNGTAAAGCWQ